MKVCVPPIRFAFGARVQPAALPRHSSVGHDQTFDATVGSEYTVAVGGVAGVYAHVPHWLIAIVPLGA